MTTTTTRRRLLGALAGGAAAAVGCGVVGKRLELLAEREATRETLLTVGQGVPQVKAPTPERARVRLERWDDSIRVAVFEVVEDALPGFPKGSMVFATARTHPERPDDLAIAWDATRWIVGEVGGDDVIASGLQVRPASAAWWRWPEGQQFLAVLDNLRARLRHATPAERARIVGALEEALAAPRTEAV